MRLRLKRNPRVSNKAKVVPNLQLQRTEKNDRLKIVVQIHELSQTIGNLTKGYLLLLYDYIFKNLTRMQKYIKKALQKQID